MKNADGDGEFQIVVHNIAGKTERLTIRPLDTIETIKSKLEEKFQVSAERQQLLKDGDLYPLPEVAFASDCGLVLGCSLTLVAVANTPFAFTEGGIVLSKDGQVATMRRKPDSHEASFCVTCAALPFPDYGSHTHRVKILSFSRNILIGAIRVLSDDIASSLKMIRSNQPDEDCGACDYVCDKWGDLLQNGGQINEVGCSNAEFRVGDIVDVTFNVQAGTVSFTHNGIDQPSRFSNVKTPMYFAVGLRDELDAVELMPAIRRT